MYRLVSGGLRRFPIQTVRTPTSPAPRPGPGPQPSEAFADAQALRRDRRVHGPGGDAAAPLRVPRRASRRYRAAATLHFGQAALHRPVAPSMAWSTAKLPLRLAFEHVREGATPRSPAKGWTPGEQFKEDATRCQISARLSTAKPRACSGDMPAEVPSRDPGLRDWCGGSGGGQRRWARPHRRGGASASFARPKSSTLTGRRA